MIDQEGGRVNRLNKIISFDNLTSEFFGNLFEKDKMKLNIIYKLFVDKTAYLLKLIGANINTVPVLDLRVQGASNIIGNRSFSKNRNTVSKMGDLCIKLFHENSIGTIIKHIPGHGLAKVDSHNFTPIVRKSAKYLEKNGVLKFFERVTCPDNNHVHAPDLSKNGHFTSYSGQLAVYYDYSCIQQLFPDF